MAANAHAVHQIPGRCLVTAKPVKTTLDGTVTQTRGDHEVQSFENR